MSIHVAAHHLKSLLLTLAQNIKTTFYPHSLRWPIKFVTLQHTFAPVESGRLGRSPSGTLGCIFLSCCLFFLFPPLCSLEDPSSLTKDGNLATVVKVLSPNHCIAREFSLLSVCLYVPCHVSLFFSNSVFLSASLSL